MLPEISTKLLEHWDNLPTSRSKPGRVSFLGMRTQVGDGYALFLGFADQDRTPCLAVKIPRTREAVMRLDNEWDVLTYLHQLGAQGVQTALPQLFFRDSLGSKPVLVTSAPLGQPMAPSMGSAGKHLGAVADWLLQLACATRAVGPASLHRPREVERARLAELFDFSRQETAVLDDWFDEWADVADSDPLMPIAAHGNLVSTCVWLHPGQMEFVNWGRGELAAYPLQDLLGFAIKYRFPVFRPFHLEDCLRVFEEAFLTDCPYGDLVSWSVGSYCDALGIPGEALEICLAVQLAREAIQEFDELSAAADRGYLPIKIDGNGSPRQPYGKAIRDGIWVNLLRRFIVRRGELTMATR